jgi:hypothetical protein
MFGIAHHRVENVQLFSLHIYIFTNIYGILANTDRLIADNFKATAPAPELFSS